MAYRPAACEPFQASAVRPGWICCECGHYNGKTKPVCYFCKHSCCSEIILPELPKKDVRRARKENHNDRVMPLAQSKPKYLTKKKREELARIRAMVR